jgi:hypothetical protein
VSNAARVLLINCEHLISFKGYGHEGMSLSEWAATADPQYGAAMRDNRPPSAQPYCRASVDREAKA